ncbi:dephospho-CoA kinase [Evansella vedderi]|uniref:Dephospho-CoA kinase n=1 Tax=Evansella vedderi TaxID=38282 RepID=A0ABT9ZUZ1_9BACI|nr:dephospho-CoA kinase [Evansella vedderi]MDQ0255059.1 dephospho-CoA kinase [Evansella vedderi]
MIVGLTGGIASGKSTVAKMLNDYGLPIVDADVIARKVVEPREIAYKKIVQAFGEEILQENNKYIDRKKLGVIVFQDEEKRLLLNSIVHPAIREEMKRETENYFKKGHETVVMDIPLLVESNLMHMVDKVLLVYVSPSIQEKRLMKRDNFTLEEARQRIEAQMPIDKKKEFATEIIYNEGYLEETKEQLEHVLSKWGIKINH